MANKWEEEEEEERKNQERNNLVPSKDNDSENKKQQALVRLCCDCRVGPPDENGRCKIFNSVICTTPEHLERSSFDQNSEWINPKKIYFYRM